MTSTTSSTIPSAPSSRPTSPTVPRSYATPAPIDLKPNPHPYAIQTSSTALLSRSNSTPHNPARTRHNYVPPPSAPSSSNALSSPKKERRGEYRGHRYSRSLSSDTPISFPVPRSSSPDKANTPIQPLPAPKLRLKRAETLPPSTSAPVTTSSSTGVPAATSSSFEYLSAPPVQRESQLQGSNRTVRNAPEDLPPNPKEWTPSQLCAYLVTALRLTGSGQLPAPVARDIASFVRTKRITGRVFLRLNDEDLEGMGMNKLWRQALLVASRTLRQNVLRGQIWGFDNEGLPSPVTSDEDLRQYTDGNGLVSSGEESDNGGVLPSPVSDHSSLYSDDSEANGNDLTPYKPGRSRIQGRFRTGRVKGMVETFERSGSESDASISEGDQDDGRGTRRRKRRILPVIPVADNASSPTNNDGMPSSFATVFTAPGSSCRSKDHSPASDKDRHHPKELGSFFAALKADGSSGGGFDEFVASYKSPVSTAATLPGTPAPGTPCDEDVEPQMVHLPLPPSPPPKKSPSPAKKSPKRREPSEEDYYEPSVQELLQSGGRYSGARAWEVDSDIGSTVKRIPSPDAAYTPSTVSSTATVVPNGKTSPKAKRTMSKAQAHQMQSFSRATGAKAWEAEADGETMERGGSGGSGGMRKVTAKRVGDIFWGSGPGQAVDAPTEAVVPDTILESPTLGPAEDQQELETSYKLSRQDSGVQVDSDCEIEPVSAPSVEELARREEEVKERERARAAEIALEEQLKQSIEATRALAQSMKARLDIVEEQVDGLVKRAEARDAVPKPAAPPPRPSPAGPLQPRSEGSRSKILSLLSRYVLRNEPGDPTSVGALPSYVLLVGLGMCAVVLRVVLRRVFAVGVTAGGRR